jgi:hypothetical protein
MLVCFLFSFFIILMLVFTGSALYLYVLFLKYLNSLAELNLCPVLQEFFEACFLKIEKESVEAQCFAPIN